MKKLLLAGIMSIVFLGVGAMTSSSQVRIKPRVQITIGGHRHDGDYNRNRDYDRRYPRGVYNRGDYGYERVTYETVYRQFGYMRFRETYRVTYRRGMVTERVLVSRVRVN